MARTLVPALLVSLLTAGSAAHGQAARNRAERAQDRRELRQDARESGDDWRDAAALEAVLAQFDQARSPVNASALAAVDARLRHLLRAELAEGQAELARDGAELRRDNRELRSDRRELREDRAEHRPGARADDRHDLRDDRRDRRDDRQDLRAEARSQEDRLRIARALVALEGRHALADLDRKRVLIVDLIQLARQEVRQDARETREDRRELREDRRETREDRRQRR
ncbi:MAG: hypothetical protein JXB05_30295 [Myxococcaceae bacterium]|nr:hypothetical protein [Myxococcaceae bacterium]